nr:membrane dipeptidase [Chloroflexia bacterium]
DLDGGYGIEQTPNDLDTIADVQKIAGLLRNRGYGERDGAAVMHGNWLRVVGRGLPARLRERNLFRSVIKGNFRTTD